MWIRGLRPDGRNCFVVAILAREDFDARGVPAEVLIYKTRVIKHAVCLFVSRGRLCAFDPDRGSLNALPMGLSLDSAALNVARFLSENATSAEWFLPLPGKPKKP